MKIITRLEDIEGLRADDFMEINFNESDERGIVRNKEVGVFLTKYSGGLSIAQFIPAEMDGDMAKVDYTWDINRETFSPRVDTDYKFNEQDYEKYQTLLYQLEAEQLRDEN